METNNSIQKSMSNWDKPGGTLGLIVASAGACGGIILLYKILPFLITLTENLWYLAILAGGLIGLGLLISNKSFRKTFSMGYFLLMRKITGIFIEINPIAILKQSVYEIKQKIKEIEIQMNKVSGLIRKNQTRLEEKKKAFEETILKLKEYKKQGKFDYATVYQRQADRLEEAIKKSAKRLEDSKMWYEVLKKLKSRADLVVLDTENEVNEKEEEYESIKAQHTAYKSIKSIFKGEPDEMDIFARTMEYIETDIAMRLGEMNEIMDGTSALLDDIDIEDGVTAAKAAEILRLYDEGGLDAIFNKKSDGTNNLLEAKSSMYTFDSEIETQDPVLVKRDNGEETAQRKYFSD